MNHPLLQKASIVLTPTAYAEDYLYSIKPAFALGSSLTSSPVNLSNDFNANGSSSITDADTFTSTGGSLDGITSKTSLYTLTVGRRFQIEIQGNTTSSGFTLGAGNGNGDEYGSGFGVHTFVSLHAQLWIRQRTSGTTNITKLSIQEVTDADFDFDRNSTGTRVNEDYLIEDVPYNLASYSEDFSNSGWTKNTITVTNNYGKSPNGEQSSTRLVIGNLTASRIFQVQSLMNGTTYTFSCYYKGTAGEKLYMEGNGIGGSGTQTSKLVTLTGRWQREELQFVGGSTSNLIYIVDTRNGAEDTAQDFEVWGVQLVKGDQPKDYLQTTDRLDIPRIDYTNGEPSILLEPSRTNTIGYSQDFSQSSWNKTNLSLTSNDIISPDGTLNASKLTVTSTGALLETSQSLSVGDTFTVSAFVKEGTNKFVRLAYSSSAQTGAWFNLEDKTVGTVNSTSASIEDYGNGWYRIISTFNSQIASGGLFLGFSNTDGATGDSVTGHTAYVWGFQVEAGSYATSLIHTSGSAVTRSADSANNAGNSDLINSTEGVFYLDINYKNIQSAWQGIALTNNNSGSNRIFIGTAPNTKNLEIYFISGGVVLWQPDFELSNINETQKIAVKYKSNDLALWVNGLEVATSNSVTTMPVGLSLLGFFGFGTQEPQYGAIKCVAVFKEALTDAELTTLTS